MEPIAAASAGLAAGAYGLFDYNRENYLYDRKMRQKQEFQVLDFRNRQAGLWREDVRDLIELTVGKMDAYTVVNVIQLGFCVELFSAGRLEPGTPQWLLWLYTLSLSGALVYLFFAVWFAMHASVAAQASSARILTQLVRLPVPSWEQLEAMRTYASSAEGLGVKKLLRVPFVDSLLHRLGRPLPRDEAADSGQPEPAVDPWDLERVGNNIYELQQKPTAMLRHVNLVRRSAVNWQCHEGFARVSMTMGTVQLLYSIMYYAIGCTLVEDGEAAGACLTAVMMVGAIMMLLNLDLSLTANEAYTMQALVFGGPLCSCIAGVYWCKYTPASEAVALLILPGAFTAHGLFLTYVLSIANVQEQPNGTMLPMRWRAVLYLDVFGWLCGTPAKRDDTPTPTSTGTAPSSVTKGAYMAAVQTADGNYVPPHEPEGGIPDSGPRYESQGSMFDYNENEDEQDSEDSDATTSEESQELEQETSECLASELQTELALWKSDEVLGSLSLGDRARVHKCAGMFNRLVGIPLDEKPAYADSSDLLGVEGTACSSTSPPLAGDSCRADDPANYLPLTLSLMEQRLEHLGAMIGSGISGFRRRPSGLSGLRRGTSGLSNGLRRGRSTRSGLGCESQPAHLSMHPAARASAFPRAYAAKHRPMRPEDADWGDRVQAGTLKPGWGKNKKLKGVGAPGAVPLVHESAFSAETFWPSGVVRETDDGTQSAAPLERPATNLDDRNIGHIPWLFFRSMTFVLAALHGAGAIWSLGRLSGFSDFHLKPLPMVAVRLFSSVPLEDQIIGSGIASEREFVSKVDDQDVLRKLGRGSPIHTVWPHTNKFVPRTISCDSTGKIFVVADDFGVYVAKLNITRLAPAPKRSELSELESEIESDIESEIEPTALQGTNRYETVFKRAPLCRQLEGRNPKDVEVVCYREARGNNYSKGEGPQTCSAMVLYAHENMMLTECPLQRNATETSITWGISNDWLDESGELIESVALNSECGGAPNASAAFISSLRGCMFVTTNEGRLVQLRRHATKPTELVPSWATTHRRPRKADASREIDTPGSSIHILPGGFVIVLHAPPEGVAQPGTIWALDTQNDRVVGEWELPMDVQWSALCGGGGMLYMLGRKLGSGALLWRFPLPPELQRSAPTVLGVTQGNGSSGEQAARYF